MRSIFFSFLLFSICSFGQDLISEPLIVKKDSVSFYTFTKEGVYESTLSKENKISYTFSEYSKQLPKSLIEIPINSLSTTTLNGTIYFLYPGGGIVYKYIDDSIVRIDDSFAHRNQFSGFFFAHNNELFLLGGYGYWSSKNLLTKFNFQTGSWDVVSTGGLSPDDGIDQGSYVITGNSVFVFNFFSKTTIEVKETPSPYLFELNMKERKWYNRGRLMENTENNSFESTLGRVRTPYGKSLFSMIPGSSSFRVVDPEKNQVTRYKIENQLSKISKNSISVKNHLIYSSKGADNISYQIALNDLNVFREKIVTKLFLSQKEMFGIYLFFSGIFLVMLVLTLLFFFKSRSVLYKVLDLSIYNEKGVLSLTNSEKSILVLLSKTNVIENSKILDVFLDKTKSLDSAIKKKNKTIKDLNTKFKAFFDHDLMQKKTDKSDSRQVVYILSPKTTIYLE
tara:strand:- start:5163 stop:6515 length:1353 start_codon:yes stop_codon:yes gene_type:complete